jgi:hypothetical protein
MPNITGELIPSNTESFTSGGTSHILPIERAKASFDVKTMTHALDGGKKMTAKRKFIYTAVMNKNLDHVTDMSPDELLASQVKHFIEIHIKWAKKGWKPDRDDIGFMAEC